MARLKYELAYYDSAVHRFNHYTTRTPPSTSQFTIVVEHIVYNTVSEVKWFILFNITFFFFLWFLRICHYINIVLFHLIYCKRSGYEFRSHCSEYFYLFTYSLLIYLFVDFCIYPPIHYGNYLGSVKQKAS